MDKEKKMLLFLLSHLLARVSPPIRKHTNETELQSNFTLIYFRVDVLHLIPYQVFNFTLIIFGLHSIVLLPTIEPVCVCVCVRVWRSLVKCKLLVLRLFFCFSNDETFCKSPSLFRFLIFLLLLFCCCTLFVFLSLSQSLATTAADTNRSIYLSIEINLHHGRKRMKTPHHTRAPRNSTHIKENPPRFDRNDKPVLSLRRTQLL